MRHAYNAPDPPPKQRARSSDTQQRWRPSSRGRRLTVVALLVTVGMILSACTGGSASGGGQAKNVATIALKAGEAPNYILPSDPQCAAVNNHKLKRLLYKPLYWFGGVPGKEFSLNKKLSLAKPPEYSDGRTKVTVTLKDFEWSDGTPVTTRDVTFFINLYKATKKEWGCYAPGKLPDSIKKMQVKDEKTMVFVLDHAYSPKWFTTNVLSQIYPLPQHAWDKKSKDGKIGDYDQTKAGAKAVFEFLTKQAESISTYDTNPLWQVVNGPWKIKQFNPRGDIVFVPNKNYSGPDKPQLNKLVEKRFTTKQAEFNALMSGNTLTTGYIPSQYEARQEQIADQGYRVYQGHTFGIGYMVLNWHSNDDSALFHQHYARQALQHMVNQSQYVKTAYNGNAFQVHGPVPTKPKNPYVSDYVKSVPYPYNPQKAIQLLKSHGWSVRPNGTSVCTNPGTGPGHCGKGVPKGKEFAFRVVYFKGLETNRTMQAFKSSAAKAGITVNLRKATFDQVVSVTNVCEKGEKICDWDVAYYGGWQFGPYPTGEDLYMPGASSGNYRDPKAVKLIRATHRKAGKEAMIKYQNYIAKHLPVIYMPRAQGGLSVVDSDLKGFARDKQALFADIYPQYWHFE